MAYIGKIPAAAALTSSDIADDIITEAKMANDAISLAELKAGTDGELISWDASGNPVAIGAGTSGHFLKSQGAGSQPVFAAAGGGMMQLVTRTAITSNASTVAFTNLEANNYHRFVLQAIDGTANSGEDLAYQFSSDNGSSYIGGSSYHWSYWQHYGSGSNNQTASSGDSKICFADGFHNSGTDEGLHGEVTISNIGNGQRAFGWSSSSHKADSSNKLRRTSGGGFLESGATIDAVMFFFTSGDISGSSYAFINHYKGVLS